MSELKEALYAVENAISDKEIMIVEFDFDELLVDQYKKDLKGLKIALDLIKELNSK